jgi:hypothetical protein
VGGGRLGRNSVRAFLTSTKWNNSLTLRWALLKKIQLSYVVFRFIQPQFLSVGSKFALVADVALVGEADPVALWPVVVAAHAIGGSCIVVMDDFFCGCMCGCHALL